MPVVSGAFMLVRRQLWDTLGGFDPVFFLYGEDADFCLRAAAAGCRPMVTARAVCQHAGGRSSTGAGKLVLLFTGKATLVRRHFPGLAARRRASACCWAACCCGPRRAGSPVPPRRARQAGRPHTGKTGGRCGPPAMNGVVVGPDSARPQARKRLRCLPAALR